VLAATLMAGLLLPPVASADTSAAPEAGHGGKARTLDTVKVVGSRHEPYRAERSSTATKTDTALRDVPQAVTVITNAMIRDQAMQGIADVVRYVPGVGIAQGEGNRDTPIFRGNSSTADLFIDGMRDDVQYFRDLYNIDHVEALKGPNAMIFGRGGSGGLINRVSKQADWTSPRALSLQAGSWAKRRLTADFGDSLSDALALRVTGLFEDSEAFRDQYEARRRGLNPSVAWAPGDNTRLTAGLEHFEDSRTADRGIPSLNGRPVPVDPATFFGDPARSRATVDVDAFNLLLDHRFGNGARLRNRMRYADYDKFYQNVYPGTVFADRSVAISAYNNATQRRNLLNQSDLSLVARTGAVQHTLLAGVELGRQVTDNHRETGYFNGCPGSGGLVVTSVRVPVSDPRYRGAIDFCQSATDADNHGVATTAAVYVQDQIEFSPRWQAVLGLRYDRMRSQLRNNRTGVEIESLDTPLSPRAGLIYRPIEALSLYGSYSIAFLPRSGEQLASLSLTTAALDPEQFRNLELGAKWDIHPGLTATAAIYRLDRSNVAVVDPADATRLVLLGGVAQRVSGVELGLSGKFGERWSVMGAFAHQRGEILQEVRSSATQVLARGAQLAQLPRRSFSLWNRYDFSSRWGVGMGVVARSAMYAAISNDVTLPGFARLDGAVFLSLSERVKLQLNVENLLDKQYFSSANSNSNISPGSPRAFNLGLNLSF
jgi:catecholate siderophore receptor